MSSTSSPTKQIVVLWEVSYGSTIIRMSDMEDILVLPLGTFESCPSLKITMPAISGTFERREIDVEFSTKLEPIFSKAITSGRAFAECYSRGWQWIRKDGEDALRTLFNGRVVVAIKNPGGRQEITKLQLITQKAELKRQMGIISGDQCQNTFGDGKSCTKNILALAETGHITVVNRNQVTITTLAAHPDRYWNLGWISADGVRIKIKEWISGTTFLLTKLLPKEWEETVIASGFKAVTVEPGCDLSKSVCNDTWTNIDQFAGVGIAIPKYNPNFENPG